MKIFFLIILVCLQGCISKGTDSLSDAASANGNLGGEASSLGFVVTASSPSAGSIAGNYNMTISGSQFDATTTFTIGGNPCLSQTIMASSSAICKVPAGVIGLQDIVATKGTRTATLTSGFQYTGPASVSSVTPTVGPATIPTLITITGTNFIDGALVNVSHPALALSPCRPVTVVNPTTITCYTPALTAAQSHSIKTSGIVASLVITNPDNSQISLNNSFDFTPAPQLSSLSFGASGVSAPPIDGVLHNGLASFTLSVNGDYFTVGMTMRIGSTAAGACSYVNATQMTCTSLPVAGVSEGNFNITLTNVDGQSVTQSTYFARKPSVTGVTPGNARFTGGDIITLAGSGLGISPTIEIYNSANTTLLGACPLATAVPTTCTAPNVGSAQSTVIRLMNDFNYRTTYSFYSFIEATVLISTTAEIGRVVQGSTGSHTITISNPSTAVTASSFSIDTSAVSAPFSFVSTTCAESLGPLASCNLVFTYAPSSLVIHKSADITLSYNDGVGAQSKIINLSGWGIELDTLMSSLNYGSIPFGVNHLGENARFTKPIVLINRGKSTVTLNSGAFSDATDFRHTGGTFPGTGWTGYLCGATLAPEAKCLVSVDFRPLTVGAKSSTYTLTYNTSHTKAVSLSGIGSFATPTTCDPSVPYYDNGSGTDADPWLICSEAHFNEVIADNAVATTRVGKTTFFGVFVQTADITFTDPVTGRIRGQSNFSYNGGGYQLINVTINEPGVSRSLFFGGSMTAVAFGTTSLINLQAPNVSMIAGSSSGVFLGGTQPLMLSNSYAFGTVKGSSDVGGLIGFPDAHIAPIDQSYFIGEITCTGSNCGGISGRLNPITNSFTHGKIVGLNNIGGLVGNQGSGTSFSSSSMEVEGVENVGGINGYNTGTISNVTSYGNVTGSNFVGGILGTSNGVSLSINRAMFLGEVNSSATGAGGIFGAYVGTGAGYSGNITESVSSGLVSSGNSSGGIWGGMSVTTHMAYVTDSFSLSAIATTGTEAGGIISGTQTTSNKFVTRSYVASPTGTNLFNSQGANKLVIGPNLGTANHGVFYLQGSGPDQTTPVGIYDLTDAQMQNQTVFESSLGTWDFTAGTGKWKYPTSGYPYPILQWMPDNWMP
jgi:hypothetical protein